MRRVPKVFVFFLLCGVPQMLLGADIKFAQTTKWHGNFRIVGEISRGDSDQLLDAISAYANDKCLDLDEYFANPQWPKVDYGLLLNSPGGDVLEALKMGEILRRLYIPKVFVGEECSSACFFLLVTAKEKDSLGEECKVGIHRPYIPHEYLVDMSAAESDEFHERAMLRVGRYLRDLHVSNDLIEKMMATPSDEIYQVPLETAVIDVPGEQPRRVRLSGRWVGLSASPYPGFDEWLEAKCRNPYDRQTEYSDWLNHETSCTLIVQSETILRNMCEILEEEGRLK